MAEPLPLSLSPHPRTYLDLLPTELLQTIFTEVAYSFAPFSYPSQQQARSALDNLHAAYPSAPWTILLLCAVERAQLGAEDQCQYIKRVLEGPRMRFGCAQGAVMGALVQWQMALVYLKTFADQLRRSVTERGQDVGVHRA